MARILLAGIVLLISLTCSTIVSYAEAEGAGIVEMNQYYAAKKEVAEAEKTLSDTVANKGDIAAAKDKLAMAKYKLSLAQERLRGTVQTVLAELPKKDSPVSKEKCYMARPLFGDLSFLGSWFENWSVGTAVLTQLVRYNLATKKTSINTNVGAGVAFRYYGTSPLGDENEVSSLGFTKDDIASIEKYKDDRTGMYRLPLYRIKSECRATTSDFGKERKEKLASSVFSITPTLYASKEEGVEDVSVQPAILVGFLDDIINIGTGFNLSGPQTGKMFLVFSLGYGFQF